MGGISAEQLAGCRKCGLAETRYLTVYGEGDLHQGLMLVGEAPGAREDESGRPFVGKAGQLLDQMLASAGLTRQDVFITSVVKCRPPQNRQPRKAELMACLPHLAEQIALYRPRVVICLGLVAAHALIDPKARLADLRGQWFNRDGVRYMVTYHPSAVLRGTVKAAVVVEDFLRALQEG